MENKFEPKTREELEAEFKELIKECLGLDCITKDTRLKYIIPINELKELFYNILKRIN